MISTPSNPRGIFGHVCDSIVRESFSTLAVSKNGDLLSSLCADRAYAPLMASEVWGILPKLGGTCTHSPFALVTVIDDRERTTVLAYIGEPVGPLLQPFNAATHVTAGCLFSSVSDWYISR
jgi:hypothetical protein